MLPNVFHCLRQQFNTIVIHKKNVLFTGTFNFIQIKDFSKYTKCTVN